MTEDGRSTREIRRIQIAKTAYMDMTSLFRSIKIKFSLRMRALTTFILSILLYGWTLNQDSRNRNVVLEADVENSLDSKKDKGEEKLGRHSITAATEVSWSRGKA